MVRFGWPVKTTKSVPPPETNTYTPPRYQEEHHASNVPFPRTITSPTVPTNTTTTQTTHFLSLPISRKQQEQRVDPPQRLSMQDMRPYQAGLDHEGTQETSSPREKSLPPTPSSSNEDVPVNHIRTTSSISIENQSLSHRPSNQFPLPTTASTPTRPSPSQAKIALAQAALAIGLPHGMPQASASSSRSDVTSTAFLTIPQPNRPPNASSGVRRAKSLHQLSRTFWRDDNDNTHDSPERPRRSLRTPFGPANALDSEGNGDRNTVEGIPSHITPPRKSLVNKASFWNRKHNNLLKPAVALPPETPPRNSFDRLSHVLPSLPPLTPLRFDTSILCSSRSSQTEEHLPPPPPGLHRRSESRNRPLSSSLAASSPDLSVQTLQTPSPGRRRPRTADSAAGRSRTLSYVHPPDHSSPLAPARTPPQNPDVATPRQAARPRSQTNPATLLHRLSANILSFGSSTPLPPTSGTNRVHTNHSPRASSPRASTSKLPPPKPRPDEESPVAYVDRLFGTISKADVASVLASSGESFYTNALQAYIDRFNFDGDPLDVALRKLLMDVGLPRETQQIDRVMETFANRYLMCNQNLFISDDHPYILAFSLIMLHTDAFNKSNKRKMTKADYIKNTQLAGIYPEVLEYYYDNIVFAPFIFVEDPAEANLQRNLDRVPSRSLSMFPAQHSLPGNGSTVTLLGKNDKIDPYFLIVKNLLDPLRVNVEQYIPFENRYSYKDNSGVWNEENTHNIFINARVIEVVGSDRRMSLGFALNFGGTGATHQNSRQLSSPIYSPSQGSALRVVKVGLLCRRDTSLDIGKRVKAGKWRLWSVILTNTQLLFFRDQGWATSLQEQMKYRDKRILVPPVPLLKPDEVLSLKDTVALHDRSHDKHCSFLLISGDRRPFLLQAPGEEDINSWVSCINYASAFKTTGVSMRAPGMSGKDVELMGVAAAASHLRDIQRANSDSQSSRTCAWSRSSGDLIDRLSSSPDAPYTVPSSQRSKIINGHEGMDLDVPSAQNNVGADQLEATFHYVKADLAAGRWTPPGVRIARPDGRPRAHSLECAVQPSSASFPEDSECNRVSVRTQVIQAKLAELDSKIHSSQLQEETDLRLLRNIAVLTPFQRATRGRLGMIVLQTSRRIQTVRLVLGMQLCHKEVLSNDLVAQEREWRRAKTIALKAATDALQSRCEPSIPRIRLDQPMIDPSDDLHPPEGLHPPDSSIAESFHTALDFDLTVSATEEELDSPVVSVRNSTPTDTPTADGTASPEPGSSHETPNTPQEEIDEEAEQWDKTRAAKRVSLVRMPSTLNVSLGRSVSGAGSVWITRSPQSKPEP